MRSVMQLLALWLAASVALLAHVAAALRCVESGMCSLGKLTPCTGDVGTSALSYQWS